MEWAVEVEDMTVAYTTKPVLWDVDMKVPIGSLAAIVGPNGLPGLVGGPLDHTNKRPLP